jgi:hypothetical protein
MVGRQCAGTGPGNPTYQQLLAVFTIAEPTRTQLTKQA